MDDQDSIPNRERDFILFTTAPRLALGSIQSLITWARGAPSIGERWVGCKADHWPPSGTEVKNVWGYTITLPYLFVVLCLIKHTIHLHGVVLN